MEGLVWGCVIFHAWTLGTFFGFGARARHFYDEIAAPIFVQCVDKMFMTSENIIECAKSIKNTK